MDDADPAPEPAERLPVGADRRGIAYRRVAGAPPTILWLGGYRSDMRGAKAERLAAFAGARGLAFCRFDYSGHGESDGPFTDGTISRWLEEADAVLSAVAGRGPAILVGSSMGAWIALRLAAGRGGRPDGGRIAGLLLLAPAPDFTARLVEPALTEGQRRMLAETGMATSPSAYSEAPDIYTQALLDDGRRNLVMTGAIGTGCPVHIIQGMADPDVPHTHALELLSLMPADRLSLTLVQGGDHRLSRPGDLQRMERALEGLIEASQPSVP